MNPNKQQLLESIHPGMKLDKFFFLKVYGYEISFPGFADQAVKALEDAKAILRKEGCTHTWSIGYGKNKKYFIDLKATEKINE